MSRGSGNSLAERAADGQDNVVTWRDQDGTMNRAPTHEKQAAERINRFR